MFFVLILANSACKLKGLSMQNGQYITVKEQYAFYNLIENGYDKIDICKW